MYRLLTGYAAAVCNCCTKIKLPTHQHMLAAEQARLATASATPLPRMLPRVERLVTALEKRRMMKATVDRIVCAHHESQLTCGGLRTVRKNRKRKRVSAMGRVGEGWRKTYNIPFRRGDW